MRILDKMRKQQAVYWAPLGTDSFGRPTYAAPVQLRVRWEESNRQFVSAGGTTEVSRAIVYTGEDVKIKGLLKFGTLSDLVSSDPRANKDVHEIRSFNKVPTIKADHFLREAIL